MSPYLRLSYEQSLFDTFYHFRTICRPLSSHQCSSTIIKYFMCPIFHGKLPKLRPTIFLGFDGKLLYLDSLWYFAMNLWHLMINRDRQWTNDHFWNIVIVQSMSYYYPSSHGQTILQMASNNVLSTLQP